MRAGGWIKSLVAGGVIIVGGPILMSYVVPTEEELFKKYNPELQKRSLEGREDRIREANEFADKLRKYSNDPRPIWTVWKEDAIKQQKAARRADKDTQHSKRSISDEMKRARLEGSEKESS